MIGLVALILGGVSFGGGPPIRGICWLVAGVVLLAKI